eukprot:5397087-Amphidinium_carterae.1
MTAVMRDGQALQHATGDVQGMKEVVFRAVTQNGCALRYASDEMKCDKDKGNGARRSHPSCTNRSRTEATATSLQY